MADSAVSTQSRPRRDASTKKRREATVSTETEKKLARAARSAQRLAQLSDVSRDDSTLDLFPDDPTRATLEAMNIDIRQGTLHGFELPDVVLAAVGALDTPTDSMSADAKAARRAPRAARADEPAGIDAQLSGLEIEPSTVAAPDAAHPVSAADRADQNEAVMSAREAASPLSPAMAAATVARSVTALRQAAERGVEMVDSAAGTQSGAGGESLQRSAPGRQMGAAVAGPADLAEESAASVHGGVDGLDATPASGRNANRSDQADGSTRETTATGASAREATSTTSTDSSSEETTGSTSTGASTSETTRSRTTGASTGETALGTATGASTRETTRSRTTGASTGETALGTATGASTRETTRSRTTGASTGETALGTATGAPTRETTRSPTTGSSALETTRNTATGASVRKTTQTAPETTPSAASAPSARTGAAFAAPWQEAQRAEAAAAAAQRAAPELDRARATAFADTVDALYGVIADQRLAATDHSRRMKWMLSIVVGALLMTVAIGITQTMLLMRLTRETTAQQHRIEQMMQSQQTAMASMLDTQMAMANAAVRPPPTAAPAPAAPQSQLAPVVPASANGQRAVLARHIHKSKTANSH
ncbi:hypothetical protein [Paraburkholderia kirstenboschensis]|uniref:Cell wall surface anchor family protein n=1 Tax=Paraburkholderia kirstenboschensis TaxID=1245436 RepID=A0ABZ0EKT6_9BURK|nr:hypothetical protein [Paraburkholderia kirstenboschensis]WOD17234.1 hypothetical protein RW095_15555 [Paraburkholderia kirstenboschensis]